MAQGQAAAIFDVDGTLVRGGTERLFFFYLIRQRKLSAGRALAFLASVVAQPRHRFRNKTYLKGMDVEETESLSRGCYREVIAPRLCAGAVACVRSHQAQGRRIVLLTGSLAFLVLPLKEDLGADWLIATELARQGRCFTGDILEPHPRGENKSRLLKDLAERQDLDLTRSYGYGDHGEDVFFLDSVGRPVAANPSWALRRLARKRQWPRQYF